MRFLIVVCKEFDRLNAMGMTASGWKAVWGHLYESKLAEIFQGLINEGDVLVGVPPFAKEGDKAPYELIVGQEGNQEPVTMVGLIKFEAKTQEWLCLDLSLYVSGAKTSIWELSEGVAEEQNEERNEVTVVTAEMRRDVVRLMNGEGREVWASCPTAALWRKYLKIGTRFEWGMYLLACSLKLEEEFVLMTEGEMLDAEHKRHQKNDPNFNKKDYPYLALDLGEARALLQVDSPMGDFMTRVDSVVPMQFSGQRGYRISCEFSPKEAPAFPVDIVVFEEVLNGYIPQVGDFVSGYGDVFAYPVAAVKTDSSWMDSPKVALTQDKESLRRESLALIYQHEEMPLSVRVVMAGIRAAGWNIDEVYSQYFSKMIPAFSISKGGNSNFVFIDTKLAGKYDFPDINEEEQALTHKNCVSQGKLPLRFQVSLEQKEKDFSLHVTQCNPFPDSLSFVLQVAEPQRNVAPDSVVLQAIQSFKRAVKASNIGLLAPSLAEDVHFKSYTAGTDIWGKITFLRYMSVAFLRWKSTGILPQTEASHVKWEGVSRPCFLLKYKGEVTACTLFKTKDGYISEMENIPVDIFKCPAE